MVSGEQLCKNKSKLSKKKNVRKMATLCGKSQNCEKKSLNYGKRIKLGGKKVKIVRKKSKLYE